VVIDIDNKQKEVKIEEIQSLLDNLDNQ